MAELYTNTYTAETKRQRYELLRSQLDNERTSFLSHWKELGDFICPRRPRFSVTDVNRGDRRNRNIIDSTATLSARTLRSGMMGGVTSPARPWFRLTTPDPDLAEYGSVKDWLHDVSIKISTVFLRSNLYNALPIVYGDIGVFGTGAMYVEEDFDGAVIRCYPFPIGSYVIANNARLKVDVFMRPSFLMTVRQLVQKFGKKGPDGKIDWSNFSISVKQAYEQGQFETWIEVCHVIHPNPDYDGQKLGTQYKKYFSCYFERGVSGGTLVEPTNDVYLSEKGYDYFPVLCPRWEVTGEDVYGTSCPGMDALGDIKQLQLGEKRSMQAIEKMVNPPMVGPPELRTTKSSILPGDITYLSERDGMKGFRPVHEVNPRIQELEGKQEQVRQRISRAFYEDLFLMLANSDRREITAREIEERHEEKLLALGPVLEQLNQDLLDPLIDVTFDIMLRQGLIPPPPDEVQGVSLKVEYISVMAQAQKLVGIAGIERFAGFVGQIVAQTQNAELLDKVDSDQMIDEYGDAVGISPRIIRSDDEVEEIRNNRAAAQAQQVKSEKIRDLAASAKDLSQANMTDDNALKRIVDQAEAGALTQ